MMLKQYSADRLPMPETATESTELSGGSTRNSNLELFRIITMLVIIAHHYVVNSGLTSVIYERESLRAADYFLLVFGWGGKTAINCFVLITGYFMCTSKITALKYGKLVGERYFYAILFFFIFTFTGYSTFSLKPFLTMLFPFFVVRDNFTACFLLFYLFIPFLNKFLHALTEKEHLGLIVLCFFIYTILPSFINADVGYNYVTWFIVLYLIASYIRLYPKQIFEDTRKWGLLTAGAVACSWMSVVALAGIGNKFGKAYMAYFFVSDPNKILAVITAVCAFLFFKNLRIRQSRFINTVAASTFGVLLIHANSDTMRRWLWRDTLENVKWYHTPWICLHAVGSVLGIFIVCTVIDMVRRYAFEKPFLKWLQKKLSMK